MKKLFLSFGLLTGTLMFSQELSTDLKFMLKNDDPREFSTYVKKNDLNKCFKIKEEPYSLLALSIKIESKNIDYEEEVVVIFSSSSDHRIDRIHRIIFFRD